MASQAGTRPIPPPRLQRQADELSEAWHARYAAFKAQQAEGSPQDGQAADEADPRSPVLSLARRPAGELPTAWRQWLATALLREVPQATVIETLTERGFDPGLVSAEIRAVLAHPYFLAGREARAHLARGVRMLGALGQLARLQPWAPFGPPA